MKKAATKLVLPRWWPKKAKQYHENNKKSLQKMIPDWYKEFPDKEKKRKASTKENITEISLKMRNK